MTAMMNLILWRASLASVVVVLFGMSMPSSAYAQAWKPTDPSELIVGAGPGGGNDNIARSMQKIIHNNRIMDTPLNVVNKPGGGGTIAFNYLVQQKGSPHHVAISSNTLLTNHITGVSKIAWTEFTPLAVMVNEYISLIVKADSQYKSGRELVEKLRSDPGSVAVGISTALGNINHIAVAAVARAGGADPKKLKVVVFPSSSASITALLGGHIDLVAGPPSIAARHLEAKSVRALGVTGPQRLGGVMANVPTWREQGLDVLVVNWRGVLGAKDITAPHIAYWDSVFAKLAATEDWKRELNNNLWDNAGLDSQASRQYMKTQSDDLRRSLVDLGFAK